VAPVASAAPAAAARPASSFSALAVPGYALLWTSGMLWHLSRWSLAFLTAYLVNDLTASPRLVQLTGAAMWAPLLVGGAMGGVVADRFDRKRTVVSLLVFLIPLVVVMALAVGSGRFEVWMAYPFLALVGIGWVVDMTSRRSLVFDLVGLENIDNAMALESLSLSGGIVVGTLLGGSAIGVLGIGEAYMVVAVLLVVALLLLARVPAPSRSLPPSTTKPLADLRQALGLLRTHAVLVAILGVTVLANFFCFSYLPLVQVVADDLGLGPGMTGVLASATGLGMMTGSLVVARTRPRRRGLVYCGGTLAALVLLIGFATMTWIPAVLFFLFASSVGAGLFSATQGTLVMTTVEADVRGRALGLLSMAIGALPIGMFVLGEAAEAFGASAAIVASVVCGTTLLVAWLATHRVLLRVEAP
jgi:predicted MFS family arabinose efflux permease